MKTVFVIATLLASASALAAPSYWNLSCKGSGQGEVASVNMSMVNVKSEDFPNSVDIQAQNKEYELDAFNPRYLNMTIAPEDQVFTATYSNQDDKSEAELSLWAIPGTVKRSKGKNEFGGVSYKFDAKVSGYFGGEDIVDLSQKPSLVRCTLAEAPGSAG